MARDEATEEREFLADLKPRTGLDLAAWMSAISAKGFADKNETIDWLRVQGFPFARASWLERIHSNGGRPIYLDGVATQPVPPAEPEATAAPPPPRAKPAREEPPAEPVADEKAALDALVAAAKGYRPLYHMLEGLIRQAVPTAAFRARGQVISVSASHEFAVVQPTSTEIRVGLDLGDRPHDANLLPPRIKGIGPRITHMIVLKDARQVNAELQALIAAANTQAAARS